MSPTVLITGVTGHIGSAVLVKALQDGYTVRAAVRDLQRTSAVLNIPAIKDHGLASKLTFVEVPDIEASDAYISAIKDVDFVIHLASPLIKPHLVDTDWQETLIKPAVAGTTNILEAALGSPSVKRVVITSSVVANSYTTPEEETTPDTRQPVQTDFSNPFVGYSASKHAALLATDDFVAQKKPQFDVVNVMPAFVMGRQNLATSPEKVIMGSNNTALSTLFNGPVPQATLAVYVHLDDAAKVHVDSLKLPAGKSVRNFGLSYAFDPNEIFAIAKRNFPQAVEQGIFKEPKGRQEFFNIKWDASETEKVFGFKAKSFEESVVNVLQQYLELQGKA